MTEVTVTSVLSSVGELVSSSIEWMGEFLSAITSSPVLTIMVIAVPLVGIGVGLLNRMFRAG